ncbi:MAG: hypothetical protein QXD43_00415 [Candidatus Aenigmatarchaeota archaeon]
MTRKDDKSILGIFVGILAIYLFWSSFSEFQIVKSISLTSIILFIAGLFFFFVSYKLVSE